MSLSLKESCLKFERYCRRHSDTPTFEEFNSKHFTNLPNDKEAFEDFKRTLIAARRSNGVPVTRRLPSLWHRFSGEKSTPVAIPKPVVQVKSAHRSFKSSAPAYEKAIRQNIRPPEEPNVVVPQLTHKKTIWTLEEYKDAVKNSASILLKEHNNLMIHLVPEERGASLESLACKLTKNAWESLRGKTSNPIKMRDGSMIELNEIQLNEGDLAEFVQSRKQKKQGPYYVRFSCI
jgi:hypothetical protein